MQRWNDDATATAAATDDDDDDDDDDDNARVSWIHKTKYSFANVCIYVGYNPCKEISLFPKMPATI